MKKKTYMKGIRFHTSYAIESIGLRTSVNDQFSVRICFFIRLHFEVRVRGKTSIFVIRFFPQPRIRMKKRQKNYIIWNLELLNGASSRSIRIQVLFLSRFAIVRLVAKKYCVTTIENTWDGVLTDPRLLDWKNVINQNSKKILCASIRNFPI